MGEQELIKEAFEELLTVLRKDTTEEEKQRIRQAFEFANEAHKGIKRRSGEPYILHPIAVARIAAKEIGLGTKSVIAALLHDVVEDTDYTLEEIGEIFGAKIASLVDGLTKIREIMGGDTSLQAESFRKMILTLADDVRVILIKIADRLHNMRTLASMPEHKQVKIASETLYIFAPLAHRMGLHAIKTELEDLSLKYEHPEEYKVIAQKIEAYHREYTGLFDKFIAPIRESLDKNGYEYTITARTKSVYSVWYKMQRRNISFDEIYDLLAVRIVFKPTPSQPEKWQCWNIYSLITDLYSPNPERLRDWVSVPKANGYEALHLTVMGPSGQWFEVQIRSERMDEIAEKGLAAHWKYKAENGEGNSELDNWLAGIKELLEQPNSNALAFLDEFKLNLYAKEIRVFTPRGHMKTLPKGATALDFAYDIHTEIGNTCIGAKVNHKLVAMSHKLQSGDQVEILTSEKQHPQEEWFDFVITAKARSHIDDYFKKNRREAIKRGERIFEKIVKDLKLSLTAELMRKILTALKLQNKEELYLKLCLGTITQEELAKELKKRMENWFAKYWRLQFFKNEREEREKEEYKDEENADVVISSCCNPIPGDDVVGMDIEGKVQIHKRKCPEAIRLLASYGNKIVPIAWENYHITSFVAVILVRGIDRMGVVNEITKIISGEVGINMKMIHFETKDGIFEGVIQLCVHNTRDVNSLITKISGVKGVENTMRG
ncbi:RelA/SpoT family protein [Odoribacter lunatus]|uniref:RelA/SpoT family protein n=1 Tax=Odoribacter lunatus TaxID=2941335 RepID=UPI00203EB785|nr:RelA/SpoT family protein [Odoribacter lunatus]